jgi:hypothetical protein
MVIRAQGVFYPGSCLGSKVDVRPILRGTERKTNAAGMKVEGEEIEPGFSQLVDEYDYGNYKQRYSVLKCVCCCRVLDCTLLSLRKRFAYEMEKKS